MLTTTPNRSENHINLNTKVEEKGFIWIPICEPKFILRLLPNPRWGWARQRLWKIHYRNKTTSCFRHNTSTIQNFQKRFQYNHRPERARLTGVKAFLYTCLITTAESSSYFISLFVGFCIYYKGLFWWIMLCIMGVYPGFEIWLKDIMFKVTDFLVVSIF